MPPPPSSLSPARRANLIAASMALLLLASLGAAYAVVRTRSESWATAVLSREPQRVGELRLMVPRQWERTDRAAPESLRSGAIFEDPEEPSYRMTVGLLPCGSPTTPAAALNAALNIMLDDDDRGKVRRVDLVTVSASPMVGLRFAGVNKDDTHVQEHLLAALTQDGTRYWLVHLVRSLPKAVVSERRLEDDRKLFDAMIGTMSDSGFRVPTPGDLRAAGLPAGEGAHWPENLELRIAAEGEVGRPLLLHPRDALDRLRLLRIRAVPDCGYTDAPSLLAPEALLTGEFVRQFGKAPEAGLIASESIGDTPTWRADLSVPDPSGGEPPLGRHLILARVAPGRSILLEVLFEPLAKARTLAAAESVIKSLASGSQGDITAGDNPAMRAALERGERLATLIRKDFEKRPASGWRYELVDRMGMPLGFTLSRYTSLRGGDPMPLRGMFTMALAGLNSQAEWEWAASRDGQRFVLESLEGNGGTRVPGAWTRGRLELQAGKLVLTQGPAVGSKSMKMEQPAPAGFIAPMSMHAWPEEFLHDPDATPAVIWLAWGAEAPAAYWVDRPRTANDAQSLTGAASPPAGTPGPAAGAPPATRPSNETLAPGIHFSALPAAPAGPGARTPATLALVQPTATGPDADVSVRLLLWPMMGMDPTRLGFDLHGRLIRVDLNHQSGSVTDPNAVTHLAVDRATLLKRYPKLQAKFDEWDKKEPAP